LTFQQLHRTSLAAEAYQQIRDAITNGDLAPATPLVETRLADQLGISRPPLREALAQLRAEGLVVAARRGGVEVAGLEPSALVEMYNLRSAIEITAVRLAALTQPDVTPLRAAIEQMRAAGLRAKLAEVLDADVAFHRGLCELSGSGVLVRAFDTVAARARMALSIDDASYMHLTEVANEHVPIVDAMTAGDEAAAARAVAEHIFAGASTTLRRLRADDQLLLRPLSDSRRVRPPAPGERS
jgi:GntR family transcriptional regulator, gluconate operon transcriptional repressor